MHGHLSPQAVALDERPGRVHESASAVLDAAACIEAERLHLRDVPRAELAARQQLELERGRVEPRRLEEQIGPQQRPLVAVRRRRRRDEAAGRADVLDDPAGDRKASAFQGLGENLSGPAAPSTTAAMPAAASPADSAGRPRRRHARPASTTATEAAKSATSHGVLRSVPLPRPWTVAAVQTAKLR